MSFPRYAEYKDSGVEWLGEIPTEWSILRGKFTFKEFNERSESGNETLLSVSEYYGVKPRVEKIGDGDFLSRAESLEGYKKCYPNDLVMNIMLAWKRGLGVTKYEGIVSPAYSVFRFESHINADFMHYLLRTDQYVDHFKTRSTGVIDSRLRLYPDSFADVAILTPPKNEQTQIAAFLDHETAKLDNLINEQKKLIDLLKEKRQAVISHAVTKGLNPNAPMKDSGVEWLGKVPEGWGVLTAKRISKIFVPQRNKPQLNTTADGISWVTMEDMKTSEIITTNLWVTEEEAKIAGSKILPKGAVISSCVGNFGVASINMIDVIINQQLQAFIPSHNINPIFLLHCIRCAKSYFEKIGTAATLIYVNQQGFENMPLAVPPQNEQELIVAFLDQETTKIDTLITKAESAIQLLQERRTALISAAVTGKIDVRGFVKTVAEQVNA